MTRIDDTQQIRFSFNVSLISAILRSLGVSLVIGVLVLLGDVVGHGGLLIPVVSLILILFIGLNMLGFLELSMSVPQPGGAYQLVQASEEGSWLAFFTGWALLVAGVSAAGILIQGFGLQFTILIESLGGNHLPQFPFALLGLILITIYKASPFRRKENGVILGIMLGIILLFCLFAIPNFEVENIKPISSGWQASFSILLISFIGLEIGAGVQSEIIKRRRNVPLALFITTLLAGILISIVGVILSGLLPAITPLQYLDPLGNMAFQIGGKASQIPLTILMIAAILLALNRIISLLIQLGYRMSKDGFWPEIMHRVNPYGGSPLFLVISLSLLIGLTLLFPLRDLSRLGSLFFILVMIGVNFSLARREQQKSSFQLPIHPWIPALVMAFDFLIVLTLINYLPTAGVLVAVGFVLFFVYGRHHSIKAKEGITVFKTSPDETLMKQRRRILVPIANPETVGSLLHLAGALVRPENGKVIALRVITVHNRAPLSEGAIRAESDRVLLDKAIEQAIKEEFRVQTMTRVSRSVADGILDTAREEDVDQIMVGWSGGTAARSLGPVLEPIVKEAPCDVLIVKGEQWKDLKSILVPTSGGPNAPICAQLAATLSQSTGAKVTGLYVQVGRATAARMEQNRKTIQNAFKGLRFSEPPEMEVIIAGNAMAGILKEAEGFDLVIVGASEQGFIDQFAFGSVPQRIAAQAPKGSMMVKGYSGVQELWFRKALGFIFNLFPTLTTDEQLSVREDLIDDAQPGPDYFILIVLSSIIASLGLLLNSPAVVIGAMLVAPLMSPILGFSLGIVLGEGRLVRTSLESIFKGIVATIIVSILVGFLSPLKELTPEILARTQPTLLDLVVALASGMAGAYAVSRQDVSAALPGVAIAAALAPPLSVVGMGFAFGNLAVAGGALLLFITNLITISLAGVLIFTLLGIRPLRLQPDIKKQVQRGMFGVAFLVILITVPLAILMNRNIKQNKQAQIIENILVESPYLKDGSLISLEYDDTGEDLLISATVRSADPVNHHQVNILSSSLEEALDQPLTLEIISLPVIRSE